jgi:type VI secretion system secreted protein VgrG
MINVGAAQEVTVGGVQTVTVGAMQVVEVHGDRTIDAKAKLSTEVGTDEWRWVHGTRETTVVQHDTLHVGDLVIVAGNSITIQTGEASIKMTADGTIVIQGKDIKIESSKIEAAASTIELESGQEFKVQAAIIKLN